MSKLKNLSSNRAITLIALIITIIVMLILVAVSVSVLVESDLIGAAEKAGNAYKTAYEQDAVGAITIGNKTYASLDDYFNNIPTTGGEGPVDPIDPDPPVDPDGGDEDEDLLPGQMATNGNGTYMGIPIPEGFTVSNIEGEYGDTEEGVNGGVVIYHIPADDLAADDFSWSATTTVGTGNAAQTYPTVQTKYNQFVWVPVPEEDAYITAKDIEDIITAQNFTDDTSGSPKYTARQKAINYLVGQGRYPMAVQIPTTDENENPDVMYRGILYNFAAGTNGVAITSGADFSISANESYDNAVENAKTYYREPGMVSYDYTTSNGTLQYNTIGLTQASLQDEYDDMVESVHDNGGFYVARYELTYETDSSGNAVYGSKRGKTVANAGTTTSSGGVNMWYGLYSKCQNLYNSDTLPVQSTMISGAQWDQIMIWMKDVKNTNDNSKYYVVDSSYMGNYNTATGGTGSPQVSGYLNNYSVKKVFDLGGNLYDWSTEAYDSGDRVSRGYSCINNGTYSPASRRGNCDPNDGNGYYSVRSALYVK